MPMSRFPEVAKGFDFQSKTLGVVDFPDEFVADCLSESRLSQAGLVNHDLFSVVDFADGPVICTRASLLGIEFIHAINKIIEESMYAEPGSTIQPPGLYVIAESYDHRGIVFLMINLVGGTPDYGKLYHWRKAHDAFGTGDNANPPVYAADRLSDYFAGLMDEGSAEAELARCTAK
jgi:hypothetical protein